MQYHRTFRLDNLRHVSEQLTSVPGVGKIFAVKHVQCQSGQCSVQRYAQVPLLSRGAAKRFASPHQSGCRRSQLTGQSPSGLVYSARLCLNGNVNTRMVTFKWLLLAQSIVGAGTLP